MYAEGAALPLQHPFGRELARALCPGFFLGEVGPALGAQPPVGAGMHASLWQPVTFTLVAEFKTHGFLPLMSLSVLLAYR